MAETHQFDINIAKIYGVNCAVILQNLWFWIRKNEANEKNYHDGYYWTYNSTKAFKDLFPYLSQKQIETALKRLRDDGVIITGNYNAIKYDRTLWYAITEKGKSILLCGEMENPGGGNGNPGKGEPIPDKKADGKSADKNKDIKSIVDFLNSCAGTSYRATSKATQGHINARLAEGFTVDDFKTVISKKCAEWKGGEMEKYLRPETLFGSKFENYLNAPAVRRKTYGETGVEIAPQQEADILDGIL